MIEMSLVDHGPSQQQTSPTALWIIYDTDGYRNHKKPIQADIRCEMHDAHLVVRYCKWADVVFKWSGCSVAKTSD
jgi:hypothetical protein